MSRVGSRVASRPIAVLRSEDTRAGLGLAAAAVVGWALISGSLGLLVSGAEVPTASAVGVYIFVTALFGLPLSLLFCFSVGLVAWRSTARRRWVRRRDAAAVGAIVGIVLALLWVALTFLPSLATRISAARFGFDDVLQVELIGLGATGYLGAVGAISGLAAWWAGGRKSYLSDSEAADAKRSFLMTTRQPTTPSRGAPPPHSYPAASAALPRRSCRRTD